MSKVKTIPAPIAEELKSMDMELINYRPVVFCPYCFEMHQEEIPAIQTEAVKYHYYCGHCGLLVSLQ